MKYGIAGHSLSRRGFGRLRDGMRGWGEICGSGTGTLGGCGDSPALGSGLQLPVQSHREAEEATRLALLAQGAHHVQIEGDSPRGEQSGQQGAKKVTNPGGAPRNTARSPGHAANPGHAPHERKKTRSRPEPQVSHSGSLVSSVAGLSSVSQSLSSPAVSRRPSAPAPARTTAAAAALASARAPASAPGAPPRPRPRPRPSLALQVEASRRRKGMSKLATPGGNGPCSPGSPPRLRPRPRLRAPALLPTPAQAREWWGGAWEWGGREKYR